MFLSEWGEFPSAPYLAGKKILMTARVLVLLKSRASLTCFRACFLPGRAKDLSASQHSIPVTISDIRLLTFELVQPIPAVAWARGSVSSVPLRVLEEPVGLWFTLYHILCVGTERVAQQFLSDSLLVIFLSPYSFETKFL